MPADSSHSKILTMGQRFKAVAAQYAARPALVFPDVRLTYAELDRLSDNAAAHLLQLGVAPGRGVAIHAEKSPLTYAAMLGALKIGAPYVVLDTASPRARSDKILECARPALILTDREFAGATPLSQLEVPVTPVPLPEINPDTPAYIMFTSGSTGMPKGVMISHASMLRFCDWARNTFNITSQDVLSGANALYFDNSVFDFSASLFNGASLVPVGRDIVTQPKKLAEAVRECTLWFSVPSLLIYLTTLRALDAKTWPKMRAIIFGGEGYPKAELKKLFSLYSAQATLWNVYGPTECTCICSARPIEESDFAQMEKLAPLGHLAPDFTGMVMDVSGSHEVPHGEIGELFLMGPQVALGYCNDPERTRTSFAPNPLMPQLPCYRTGDLVYQDAKTGYYHFAGRKDNQIKHMGYRIELEEIEAAMAGLVGVAQAAVVYHKNEGYGGRIVAFVSGDALSAEQLKSSLREKLPAYMVPEEIHLHNVLPKNANGKVDRKALAATYGESHA